MYKLDLSNTELNADGLLYEINNIQAEYTGITSDFDRDYQPGANLVEVTLGDGSVHQISIAKTTDIGAIVDSIVRRAYIGEPVEDFNMLIGDMTDYYPVIDDDHTIVDWHNAHDWPDRLTLDEELQALREATPAEYSHGCRHEWLPCDDMVFVSGEHVGSSCDVFCTKCNKGALLDGNGDVIPYSIDDAELTF
jgi:hypothetical protein